MVYRNLTEYFRLVHASQDAVCLNQGTGADETRRQRINIPGCAAKRGFCARQNWIENPAQRDEQSKNVLISGAMN
jgi:hypothetical protein